MTRNIYKDMISTSLVKYKKYAYVGVVFILSLTLSLSAQIVAFRVLGLHDYGTFSALYNLAAIASVIAATGFDVSSLRFFSQLDFRSKSSFMNFSIKCIMRSSALTSVIYFLICQLFYGLPTVTVLLSIMGFILWAIARLFSALLRTVNRFNTSLLIDRYSRDGMITLVCGAAVLTNKTLTLNSLLLIIILGGVMGLVAALIIFRPYFFETDPIDINEKKIWLSASMGLLVINALELTFGRIDIIVISYLSSPNESAVLNIISTVSSMVAIPSTALTIIVMPILASLYHSDDFRKLKNLLIMYSLISFLIGSLIALLIYIYFDHIIQLYGGSAVEIVSIFDLFIVTASRILLTLCSAAAPLILMSGRVTGLIFSYIGVLILKLAGLIYFVPVYGLTSGVWNITMGFFAIGLLQSLLAGRIFYDRGKQINSKL